jgi:hypothetical protein
MYLLPASGILLRVNVTTIFEELRRSWKNYAQSNRNVRALAQPPQFPCITLLNHLNFVQRLKKIIRFTCLLVIISLGNFDV